MVPASRDFARVAWAGATWECQGVVPVKPPNALVTLVDAARSGDERAVIGFVELTRSAVWQVCRVLGSPGEEEDLVQETYVRALVGLESFKGQGSVLGWLLTIARNVCADDVRRRQRQVSLVERLRNRREDSVEEMVDWHIVADVLSVVDPDQRDPFLLTQMLGFRYGEAAQLLGCPIGTVRSRVARARQRLAAEHVLAEVLDREA